MNVLLLPSAESRRWRLANNNWLSADPQKHPIKKAGCFFRHTDIQLLTKHHRRLKWNTIAYLYFWKLYFSLSDAFTSSSWWVKYPFHPGQKLICHLQNLPINDLGFLSYLALNGHVSQRYFFAIIIYVLLALWIVLNWLSTIISCGIAKEQCQLPVKVAHDFTVLDNAELVILCESRLYIITSPDHLSEGIRIFLIVSDKWISPLCSIWSRW